MKVKNTIKKIKLAFNVSTNKQLAVKLGISTSSLDAWPSRNVIPEKHLLKTVQLTGVSMEWLTNEDEPKFIVSDNSIGQMSGKKAVGFFYDEKDAKKSKLDLKIDKIKDEHLGILTLFLDCYKKAKKGKDLKGLNDVLSKYFYN